MFASVFHRPFWIGIRVSRAAQHEHGLHTGIFFLDQGLGKAGVITAELVIVPAKRGAMDGSAE